MWNVCLDGEGTRKLLLGTASLFAFYVNKRADLMRSVLLRVYWFKYHFSCFYLCSKYKRCECVQHVWMTYLEISVSDEFIVKKLHLHVLKAHNFTILNSLPLSNWLLLFLFHREKKSMNSKYEECSARMYNKQLFVFIS